MLLIFGHGVKTASWCSWLPWLQQLQTAQLSCKRLPPSSNDSWSIVLPMVVSIWFSVFVDPVGLCLLMSCFIPQHQAFTEYGIRPIANAGICCPFRAFISASPFLLLWRDRCDTLGLSISWNGRSHWRSHSNHATDVPSSWWWPPGNGKMTHWCCDAVEYVEWFMNENMNWLYQGRPQNIRQILGQILTLSVYKHDMDITCGCCLKSERMILLPNAPHMGSNGTRK